MTDPIENAITERLEDDSPTEVRNDLIAYLTDLNRHEDAWMDKAEERLVEAHS